MLTWGSYLYVYAIDNSGVVRRYELPGAGGLWYVFAHGGQPHAIEYSELHSGTCQAYCLQLSNSPIGRYNLIIVGGSRITTKNIGDTEYVCTATRMGITKQTRISLSDYPNVRVLSTGNDTGPSIYDTVRGEFVTAYQCGGRVETAAGESSTNDCPSTYRPTEKTCTRAREMLTYCGEYDVWDGNIAIAAGASVHIHDRSGYMASSYTVDHPIDSIMFVAENIVLVANGADVTIINVVDGSQYVII